MILSRLPLPHLIPSTPWRLFRVSYIKVIPSIRRYQNYGVFPKLHSHTRRPHREDLLPKVPPPTLPCLMMRPCLAAFTCNYARTDTENLNTAPLYTLNLHTRCLRGQIAHFTVLCKGCNALYFLKWRCNFNWNCETCLHYSLR